MTMAHATSPDLLVLHALRCIGFAGQHRVVAASGLTESDVESELIDLARAGLVGHTSGDFGGWGITDAGKAVDARRIAEELDTAGTRAIAVRAYEGFLVLNPELLDLCTAWQLRSIEGVLSTNDHTDPDYDERVLNRLTDLDRRAGAVCAELGAAMTRFARYRIRLSGALARVRSGALEYVTDDVESYHAVWFQLHEDLLATLGIPR